jgi:methyl-accepting chemotaxis protein
MKLVTKLTLVIAGGLIAAIAAGGAGLAVMQSAVTTYAQDVQAMNDAARDVARVRSNFQTQVQEWKNVLLRGGDAKQLERYWNGFQKSEASVRTEVDKLAKALPAGPSRELLEKFGQAHARMGEGYRKGLEAFKAANFDAAAGDQAVKGMDREPNETLAATITSISEQADTVAARADHSAAQALTLATIGMLLTWAIVVTGAAVYVRVSLRRLREAAEAADRVAGGDLSRPIEPRGNDELTQVAQALLKMQHSLARIVGSVRGNAESVATASSQIAQGNLDLSQRTEEQASALEETASSMEELSTTVRQNADNARQANQLVQGASSVAERGGEVVGQAVSTMQGINERAQKMADIIGVIDGIAFQTNILALNAAVEAARAGEQGRGFAVVAGEVRNLAQRSAQAAKEIKLLITDSIDSVEQGATLVNRAGDTMQEVVQSIRRVSDIIGEISSASSEQSAGVAQVSQAVTQMDQATQQNAALVEESAAAADSLRRQAQALVQAVAFFRLDAKGEVAAAAPASTPAQVLRPNFGRRPTAPVPAPARTGTDDWTSF